METPRTTWLHAALVAALGAAMATPSSAQTAPARSLALGEATTARLGREFARALARRFEVDLAGLTVDLEAPRLRPVAGSLRLEATSGRVRMQGVDAWGLPVTGEVTFHDLALDYPSLVTGELALLGRPRVAPDLEVRRRDLLAYMRAKGVLDPVFEVDPAGGELEVGGAYRLRLLFLHLRPEIRVRGRLAILGTRAGFTPTRVSVTRVPGLVRGIMRRHVERLASQGIFTELSLDGVTLAGGAVRVTDASGQAIYSQALPPRLAASE